MDLKKRLALCVAAALAPLLPIAARLAYLQIVQHDKFSTRVENSTERRSIEIVPRGRILDRKGRVLAESLPAWSAFLDLKVLREEPDQMRGRLARLSALLRLPDLSERARAEKKRTLWLKRRMDLDELNALKALKLRSVGVVPDERRHYPNGQIALGILGSVNAEGDGVAGLERAFNEEISGRAVRWNLTRDGAGRAILAETELDFSPPPDLTTTLDRSLQFIAEEALRDTVERHKAQSGIVIVQDPGTGDILALASFPDDALKSPAVQAVFEPGSTFKIVVAAAALETAALAADETIDCEGGKWQVTPSVSIKDHDPLGALNLTQIITHSSNIGTAKIALKLGPETFHRFCRLFGFGYKTGLPIPAESAGLLTDAAGLNRLRLANAAFGQGVAVTAAQLAAAFSSVANGGLLMEPRLVVSVGSDSPRGPVKVRRVMSEKTAAELRLMLESVVEHGTGLQARLPGYSTAGKTGTAQKVDPKTAGYSKTDYVSSFAGYVPAGRPRYVVISVVDSPKVGYYGSEVAAPLFARVAKRILALHGVAPDRPMALRPHAAKRPEVRAVPKAAAPLTPAAPVRRPAAPAKTLGLPLPRPALLKGAADLRARSAEA